MYEEEIVCYFRKLGEYSQRARQNLYEKYSEEWVGVIEESDCYLLNSEYGEKKSCFLKFNSEKRADIIEKSILKKLKFYLRYQVESAGVSEGYEFREYKQIIPYILVQFKDRVLCVQRLSGDDRIVDMISLGQGGHINPKDVLGDSNLIRNCAYRELREEFGLYFSDIEELEFIGHLYDNSDSIGRDHYGLIFIAHIKNSMSEEKLISFISDNIEDSLKLIGFLTEEEIKERLESYCMESWSELLFDSFINIRGCDN